ncbi:MAG: CaiB/BaiF CoA transferase family protein [Planctomycetota bacterium]|jgi:alpha-methylacyl-CoA racemase
MGPLSGIKVVEIGSIGAGPFCAQMLADMGADIIRVDRQGAREDRNTNKYAVLNRGRRSVAVDLKNPKGVEAVLRLVEQADALVEGFRPGVAERLGIGPDVCLKCNPKLLYGRMTGWGQNGPLARMAGHDINYIALSGALHTFGSRSQPPIPPLNLLGDFGGGGMLLAFGIVCGILESQTSGKGQVVDASMLEGTALMMNLIYGFWASGLWSEQRENNLLDGAAHFYGCYETADGKWVAIGAIEPQFYKRLLKQLKISDPDFDNHEDKQKWPKLKAKFATVFKTKTRDEWCKIMEECDVCFTPVLSMSEVANHPQNKDRNSFIEVDGILQAAPAPKFSRTKPNIPEPPPTPGEHNETVLKDWGFSKAEINNLKKDAAI